MVNCGNQKSKNIFIRKYKAFLNKKFIGKSNTSRKGLTFQFKTKNSKYDFPKIKEYEKKLQEQINLREKKLI